MYNISEESVSLLIERIHETSKLEEGRHEVVEKTATKYQYPLKAVFSLEEGSVTVITAYPLKKG